MRKIMLIGIGLMMPIAALADTIEANISSTAKPPSSLTGQFGKASERNRNILLPNQQGSDLKLKKGHETPFPSRPTQSSQPKANYPNSHSFGNQIYRYDQEAETNRNGSPLDQQGDSSNMKRNQRAPLIPNHSSGYRPFNSGFINQNYGNSPKLKQGRNIFTGRDQSKSDHDNDRRRGYRH